MGRFLMISIRTTEQGRRINSGKDTAEYEKLVSTLSMNPEDMQELNIASGTSVKIRSDHGEAVFQCKEGSKVPKGMIIVPYGPPTCRLYIGDTDGTGMPTTKGWEVDVEPVAD